MRVLNAVFAKLLNALATIPIPTRVCSALPRAQTYGLIISDIANPFFPELVKSFEHLAVDHNHEVLIGNTDYHPERMEQCVRRMP